MLDASVEDQISTSFGGNRRLGIRLLRIGDFDISARWGVKSDDSMLGLDVPDTLEHNPTREHTELISDVIRLFQLASVSFV